MTTRRGVARIQSWRYLVIYALIGVVTILFVGRLFVLQILQGHDWAARSDSNRTTTITSSPARGIIYDRNGIVLARNVASYNIVVTPAYLPDDDGDIQNIYRQLSNLTGIPVSSGTVEDAKLLKACTPGPGIQQWVDLGASNAPYDPVAIDCNVSEQIAMTVREHAAEWPGVGLDIQPVRDYPTNSLTANIIGFLGPIPAALEQVYRQQGFLPGRDKVGYAGVELSMDDVLIGKPGKRVVEVDVAGQVLRNLQPPAASSSGKNIILTIDTRLQQAAQAALVSNIDSWNAYFGTIRISSGVVIAMNPKTGEILAMAQYPSYENNRLARIIPEYYYNQLVQDPRHPLLNFAVQTEYPPGSTFKLGPATGALNEGVVTPNTVIDAPGQIVLTNTYSPTDPGSQQIYRDWSYDTNPAGLGKINFLQCIAFSSDACFYKVGGGYKTEIPEGVDMQRIQQYARALGYDALTGIELPGELPGLVPDPTWKRRFEGENWSTGDTYLATIGQGYDLATPLQVLLSAATIANNGRQMQPTIIRQIVDNEGNVIQPFTPRLRWDITTDPIIQDMQCKYGLCTPTSLMKTVQPWVVQSVKQGMRLAVAEPGGTLNHTFSFANYPIAVAGKTGTAEYCDDVAKARNQCSFGNWPSHAWTVAFAPYDDPEIAIITFLYNGIEGGRTAAPIVKSVMDAYFELKSIDIAQGITGSNP
jgi:penicillin-binding protein 2